MAVTRTRQPSPGDNAGVSHLAAGFAVEGSGFGNHLHLLAGLGLGIVPGLDDEGQDVAVAFQGVVAQEFGGRPLRQLLVDLGEILTRAAFPGLPGGLPLRLHVGFEAFQVQHQALLPEGVLDQVQGKAVSVIELEGHLAGQDLLAVGLEGGQFFAQQLQAMVQGIGKPLFLADYHPGHDLVHGHQFGINVAHEFHYPVADPGQERGGQVQEPPEADGPAHDAPQHVAPAFVGRQHPVGDQKSGGPGMVGDDPEGHVLLFRWRHRPGRPELRPRRSPAAAGRSRNCS